MKQPPSSGQDAVSHTRWKDDQIYIIALCYPAHCQTFSGLWKSPTTKCEIILPQFDLFVVNSRQDDAEI